MIPMLRALTMAAVLTIPCVVQAQQITFTTELKNYGGKNAYLAMYLTDANGGYQQTLWVSGEVKRYYRDLRGWAQASGLKNTEYDGKTGATIPSGQSYSVILDIDEALIDAGYQIHIDSAIERKRPGRDDVVVELTHQGADKVVNGTAYIQSFSYAF